MEEFFLNKLAETGIKKQVLSLKVNKKQFLAIFSFPADVKKML